MCRVQLVPSWSYPIQKQLIVVEKEYILVKQIDYIPATKSGDTTMWPSVSTANHCRKGRDRQKVVCPSVAIRCVYIIIPSKLAIVIS